MNRESKQCQNCHQEFWIEPEDFDFYRKIDVPAPTWCPECRVKRRMIWRSELVLYKRKSSFSGEEIVSQYSDNVPFPIYGIKEYFGRNWEIPYLEYNPDRSFFDQFRELLYKTPKAALLTDLQSFENGSVYQNSSSRNKNCYMVSAAGDNEDCMYGNNIDHCKSSLDNQGLLQVQFSYECIDCGECSNIFFSEECRKCINGYFLYECKNCIDCFGCAHLRHKSYCWFNQQLSKEEYQKKIEDFKRNISFSKIIFYKNELNKLRSQYPVKFAHMNADSISTCTGDYAVGSKNTKDSFLMIGSENSRYCFKLYNGKECYDTTDWGDPAELCYESITVGKGANKVLFSNNCWPECRNIQYCDSCSNSHHCFGCIGLKNASYRILNKQYSEGEYNNLVSKIIDDMRKRGEYGEFFPVKLSLFSYNESIAQQYFPLTREEAISQGYRWKDPEPRNYQIQIPNDELPDNIKDVTDNIIGKVIECAHSLGSPSTNSEQTTKAVCNEQCTEAFKIIPQELQFYRQMNLPLPRLCPNCRYYARLKQRNPLKLWKRRCMCSGDKSQLSNSKFQYQNTIKHFHKNQPCPNEFETSYAPDRPEIVYCEACYNAEVV